MLSCKNVEMSKQIVIAYQSKIGLIITFNSITAQSDD